MNRARENRLVALAVALFGIAVVVALVMTRGGAGVAAIPFVAPAPTPTVTAEVRAQAADLQARAAQMRAEGKLGTAIELNDQALTAYPQYDAAQRFALTVVPQATAVEQSGQARATASAQVELRQAQAGAAAQRVYVSRAGLALQQYADSLAVFFQGNREARDRPALIRDAEWRGRTAAALARMRNATDALTALQPVPTQLAPAAVLFDQLAAETAGLQVDYSRAAGNAPDEAMAPLTADRTARASELTQEANIELRRTRVAPAA